MLHHRRLALLTAGVFYVFWQLALLAGADFPPPPGFVVIIITVLLCALVVYRRAQTYMQWQIEKRPYRWFWAMGDGILAGLILALVFMLLPFVGEPSRPRPGLVDRAIWCAVLSGVGMVNSLVILAVSAFQVRGRAASS